MTLSPRAIEAAAEAIVDCHDKLSHHATYKDYIAWESEESEQGDFAREWMAARRLEAKAALTAALAVDGLCLVPKEPSDEMYFAGCEEIDTWTDPTDGGAIQAVYRAMIAAASDGEYSPPAGTEG